MKMDAMAWSPQVHGPMAWGHIICTNERLENQEHFGSKVIGLTQLQMLLQMVSTFLAMHLTWQYFRASFFCSWDNFIATLIYIGSSPKLSQVKNKKATPVAVCYDCRNPEFIYVGYLGSEFLFSVWTFIVYQGALCKKFHGDQSAGTKSILVLYLGYPEPDHYKPLVGKIFRVVPNKQGFHRIGNFTESGGLFTHYSKQARS